MAIERLALFALSIAYTVSVVALPSLPADIPPRAGFDGPFVGAPLVAFLLPVTATAMWWLSETLARPAATEPPRAMNSGAGVAIFLVVFHIIMLMGFIGGLASAGRMLGMVVGVFLMLTGNELSRLRLAGPWRAGTMRLAGYVRVVMGIAVCAAASLRPSLLTATITLAIVAEAIAIPAALLRRRRVVACVIAACGSMASVSLQAQDRVGAKVESLPAFIDATVPKLMEQGHVPGAAVAIVYDGRVVVLRGYGAANLEEGERVDPARTMFRIGSVSKVLTSVAALQLAETGRLDLHRDVRTYLADVPLRSGAAMHHLLTHTAGFEERFAISLRHPTDGAPSLAERLRVDPPGQVWPAGSAYSYSNANFALAGLVIERVSGRAFEDYLEQRVLQPAGMSGSTARAPTQARLQDLAKGYRWTGREHQIVPQRFGSADPAGGISTTALDMSRFMLALLGDGSLETGRLLAPASVTTLLAAQYKPDPHIAPRGYAFMHWFTHSRRLQHHDGSLGDHSSVLTLSPQDRFGIFVASNGGDTDVGNRLLEPLLTYVFGPGVGSGAPPLSRDSIRSAPRVAGTYRDYRHARNDLTRLMALMPMIQSRVTIDPDGGIRWRGHRWVEVEPLVFCSTDVPDYGSDRPDCIVFRHDARGAISQLHAWGATYERIGWSEQAPFHLSVFVACFLSFIAYVSSAAMRRLRRRGTPTEGRAASRCALAASIANLLFVCGLPFVFGALRASIPPPPPVLIAWLMLPLASAAATSLLPGFAVLAWREQWWTRAVRLRFSAMAILSVAFLTFLNYWKLFGLP